MTELQSLSVTELLARQSDLRARKARLSWDAEVLQDELARRFGEEAKKAYAAAGKSHGIVRLPGGGGNVVKVDTKQRVSWDQERLKALAATMTWEDAQHYFRITFDVKETTYNALPPGSNIKPALTEARTTKNADPVFELVPVE